MKIEGKIAAIVDNRQVIINRGREHGIVIDGAFSARLDLPDVVDPDDPENILKGASFEKALFRVTAVFDKMCQAVLFSSYIRKNTVQIMADKLVKNALDTSNPLIDQEDWYVKVGDRVETDVETENEKILKKLREASAEISLSKAAGVVGAIAGTIAEEDKLS